MVDMMKSLEKDRDHVLLVGEPGLAKTKLLKAAVELVSNSKYMSMSNTSGISLIAMIEKTKDEEIHCFVALF